MTRFSLFPLAAVLLLAACKGGNAETNTETAQTAESVRIISVGPSNTDVLMALGQAASIVGTDLSSRHLPGADTAAWANVGYHRALNPEGILGLRPTVLFLDTEAGPPPVLVALEGAGVKVVKVPTAETPEAAVQAVRTIGQALNLPGADSLALLLAADFGTLATEAAARPTHPRALVLYARGGPDRLFMIGTQTPAHQLLGLLGATQAAAFENSKALTAEAVIQAAPEWLILPRETFNTLGGAAGIKAHPVLGNTPAGRNGQILPVPDGTLFGFGPSTPGLVRHLAQKLFAPQS